MTNKRLYGTQKPQIFWFIDNRSALDSLHNRVIIKENSNMRSSNTKLRSSSAEVNCHGSKHSLEDSFSRGITHIPNTISRAITNSVLPSKKIAFVGAIKPSNSNTGTLVYGFYSIKFMDPVYNSKDSCQGSATGTLVYGIDGMLERVLVITDSDTKHGLRVEKKYYPLTKKHKSIPYNSNSREKLIRVFENSCKVIAENNFSFIPFLSNVKRQQKFSEQNYES